MTPAQSRAARSLIDITQIELARLASLGQSTVIDFERERRIVSAESVSAMRTALETAGIEFIGENGGGPGVRLKKGKAGRV
jgi:transcriptional regulator with XRE-family HTH domain